MLVCPQYTRHHNGGQAVGGSTALSTPQFATTFDDSFYISRNIPLTPKRSGTRCLAPTSSRGDSRRLPPHTCECTPQVIDLTHFLAMVVAVYIHATLRFTPGQRCVHGFLQLLKACATQLLRRSHHAAPALRGEHIIQPVVHQEFSLLQQTGLRCGNPHVHSVSRNLPAAVRVCGNSFDLDKTQHS